MTVSEPVAHLSTLPRADGSATYSHAGYTITATANGPLEVQRRDEDPDEASVDVVVRPAAGVGGPSERHLESILQKTLHEIILVQDFPRCLIQIVLQIQSAPENDYVNTKLNLPGLNIGAVPALLQSAVLALLSASIPLRTTATAASFAYVPDNTPSDNDYKLVSSFSPRDAAVARSTHVLAFAAHHDKLLLAESEGEFSMDEWDDVVAAARKMCCATADDDDADGMALDKKVGSHSSDGPDMRQFVRSTMQGKLEDALKWKQ